MLRVIKRSLEMSKSFLYARRKRSPEATQSNTEQHEATTKDTSKAGKHCPDDSRRQLMRWVSVATTLMLAAAAAHAADSSVPVTAAQGTQGTSGIQKPALKVYDAHHKVIGQLVSYNGADGVYLTINGATTFTRIGRLTDASGTGHPANAFAWVPSATNFESADCSGQPVVNYDSNWPRSSVSLRQGADVVVYVGSDTNTTPIATTSVLEYGSCTVLKMNAQSVRPESTYDVTQRYPEPLTIDY
jgi:hypothetical protein